MSSKEKGGEQDGERWRRVTLPGVSVLIKGEGVGVATDINRKYSITIPERE